MNYFAIPKSIRRFCTKVRTHLSVYMRVDRISDKHVLRRIRTLSGCGYEVIDYPGRTLVQGVVPQPFQ